MKATHWTKWVNLLTLALLILGGLNSAGTVLGGSDAVSTLIGAGGERVAYVLVGLSALWQLMPFIRAWRIGEAGAEADTHAAAR
jgi:uncharacterized membrane protein YuzA (DUF378 family)